MEHGAVVVAVLHVLQEVLDGLGRLLRVELEADRADVGLDVDLRIGRKRTTGYRGQGKDEKVLELHAALVGDVPARFCGAAIIGMLEIHNSLGRTKQQFLPLRAGEVRMYVCGMTVWTTCTRDMPACWWSSTSSPATSRERLLRHLCPEHHGHRRQDHQARERERRIHPGAHRALISANEEDFSALGLLKPEHEPRATHSIPGMIRMIEALIARGHAYAAANGDVYYDVSSFEGYGRLSGKDLRGLAAPSARRNR